MTAKHHTMRAALIGAAAGILVGLCVGCVEPEDAFEVEPELRGSDVSVCASGNQCTIDLNGNPCPPAWEDVCAPALTPTWSPRACTELAGLCVVTFPGDECPQGWFDACEYYG